MEHREPKVNQILLQILIHNFNLLPILLAMIKQNLIEISRKHLKQQNDAESRGVSSVQQQYR